MAKLRISMRASLSLAVVLMGLLSMALAIITGEIYRKHAVDNQRVALVELVGLKVDDLLRDLTERSRELGLSLQHESNFAQLIADERLDFLRERLNAEFHQYFATANVLSLERLYVYDTEMRLIAASTEGAAQLDQVHGICPAMLVRARQRQGAERLQTLADLCVHNKVTYHAVLVPVGGLFPHGYIQVVTSPAHNIRPLETALGMPLRIAYPDGVTVFQSEDWPMERVLDETLVAIHDLNTSTDEPALSVSVAADVSAFYRSLARTRAQVVVSATVITLFVGLVALYLLQKSTLQPLQVLSKQLRLVRDNKAHLGEHVAVGGNSEIRELARNFNAMTTELSSLYETLEHMAFVDPLTKLANRTRFHDLLHRFLASAQQANMPFALFIIDVDRFKAVNDTLGHNVGDQLLLQVSHRLQQVLRKSDITTRLDSGTIELLAEDGYSVARLGGDEFSALLPAISSVEEASIVAQKLLSVLEKPFLLDGQSFNISSSIGIVLSPMHGTDAGTLLRRADVAMSEAKQNQTGYHFYDSSQDQHRLLQLTLEKELRDAIDNDELMLHFQPQLNMSDGSVWGCEALVRWRHPTRGFIPPDRFIPLAEQSGLIHPLTVWVLARALEQCANWHRRGFPINVSVNLSARSLQAADIPQLVGTALDATGVAPGHLSLEITESAVMSDPARAMEILSQLDCMGVDLSIDDFGTGYSSMSYLKRLPVDEIKIDRSFVMDMKEDNNDAVIVHAIIDLAHNMGLRAVAEGVENGAVWDLLNDLGCDIAQGFHMARPMAAEDLDEWLSERRAIPHKATGGLSAV